jgi:hypothetical protein
MLFVKRYDDKEIECRYCHQKVKPLLKLNRTKIEFIGSKYTGKDKLYWIICPNCKKVIGSK